MPRPKKKFPPTEPPVIGAVRKIIDQQREWIEKRLADVTGYMTGALEQLMFQQGQEMTVQAGIIQYLNEQLAPGAESAIRSLVEQNIARMKAEREEREKAANEAAEAKRAADALAAFDAEDSNRPDNQRNAIPDGACPSCGSLSPQKCHQPCTDPPASAYVSVDDPRLEVAPAHIAPEPPADAPADSPGST